MSLLLQALLLVGSTPGGGHRKATPAVLLLLGGSSASWSVALVRMLSGWTSDSTVRAHVDAHLAGSLSGRVPSAWLQDRSLQQCLVCGLSVSTRFGIHPTCRPAARAGAVGSGPFSGPSPLPFAGSTVLETCSSTTSRSRPRTRRESIRG